MPEQIVPEIPPEMKTQLKTERLNQLRARIYNMQMDIASYEAISDATRLPFAQKELDKLVTTYYAVEAMT